MTATAAQINSPAATFESASPPSKSECGIHIEFAGNPVKAVSHV